MSIPTIPTIPKELLPKLINLGGTQSKLRCKGCKKYTDHVTVSWAETYKSIDCVGKAFWRMVDLVPGGGLVLGNPFACMTCGRIRYEGGVISDWLDRKWR